MPLNLFFNSVNVVSVQNNAGVFVGENSASGWDTNRKQQTKADITGFGNRIFHNSTIFNDQDLLDTPISDNDLEPSIFDRRW